MNIIVIFTVYILHLADVKLKITAKKRVLVLRDNQKEMSAMQKNKRKMMKKNKKERDFTTRKSFVFSVDNKLTLKDWHDPMSFGPKDQARPTTFFFFKVNVNFIYSWHFESLWLKFQDWHKIVVKIRVTLWKLLVLVYYYYYLFIL